jgi:Ca-activated chloride channel family protein
LNVRWIASIAALMLVLTGCVPQDKPAVTAPEKNAESGESTVHNSKPSVPKASRDFKGIMMQNPGLYSGDQYDEQKVKQALDRMPSGLSTDQLYDHLVYLLGENYQPIYQKLKAMDPAIQPNVKTPDGKFQLPRIDKFRVQIVLDASGSMAARVPGGQKMALAKAAIREFVSNLPEGSDVSLRVYGHKGSGSKKDKQISCQSNEVLYPMGRYDSQQFEAALNKVRPAGWTPLASAIAAARADLQQSAQENVKNVVYVVSDGIETCGGNPVEEAKKLSQAGIRPVVNIVGFDVDDAGQRQLQSVAEAAGGVFKSVHSARDLQAYLQAEKERLMWEWETWGTASKVEAWKIWGEKYNEITHLCFGNKGEGIASLLGIEWRRMKNAVDYLAAKGKIQDKFAIEQQLTERHNIVHKNAMAWHDYLSAELQKALNAAEQGIDQQTGQQQSSLQ